MTLSTHINMRRYLCISMLVLPSVLWGNRAVAAESDVSTDIEDFSALCAQQAGQYDNRRIVCADLAAVDQTIVYNRFGSFNPFGMMYALRRDLSPLVNGLETQTSLNNGDAAENADLQLPQLLSAADCSAMTGTEAGHEEGTLSAGNVRLKDCKRPRPITLRVNAGDLLLVRVSNLLHQPKFPEQGDAVQAPGFSDDFCQGGPTQDANRSSVYDGVSRGSKDRLDHSEVACLNAKPDTYIDSDIDNKTDTVAQEAPDSDVAQIVAEAESAREVHSDWPSTRDVNFVVQGLEPVADPVTGDIHGGCLGLDAVAPDDEFLCAYKVDQEGVYFLGSHAAPAGGEGDGGSIVHGLFGSILVERQGSRWYRSQTSSAAFDAVWPQASDDRPRHSRTGVLDYEKTDSQGIPYLNMARPVDGVAQTEFANATAVELVHSDLNAIVYCDANAPGEDCPPRQKPTQSSTAEPAFSAFREFSVFFHDELKTFYTKNFDDIPTLGQMTGVKDGFALNYGASGMGTILMANRKGIGPSADCMECLYEEFFLTSWANGDPALLERFADDPSNVHHSYLNDPVVFRNFHAGPKETHVFHLHAHQWFAGNDPNRGTYLDSQTVAPQQGFSYNIYHGGRNAIDGKTKGFWDTQGSGNRNRTLGDSIFHCHLYPHFAQGMWALWRVHDVLEDGTRLLPDGQPHAGLSIDFAEPDGHKRAGSIDRISGEWLAEQRGTPVPAIIPLPGEPVPLLPTYKESVADTATPMPGFPFYIAGQPGHRPPQAPLDIAQDLGAAPTDNLLIDDRTAGRVTDESTAVQESTDDENEIRWLDGGIGRHVVTDGSERELGIKVPDIDLLSLDDDQRREFASQLVAKSFALGDLSGHLSVANLELLDNIGTPLERGAMGFHYNGLLYDPNEEHPDDTLSLKNVMGEDVVVEDGENADHGQYSTILTPLPGVQRAAVGGANNNENDTADSDASESMTAKFAVNGSAPKPGAPFADPCGAPVTLTESIALEDGDPLFTGQGPMASYHVDPQLLGFRRYEVSAVQLDLIVNQAGWHDPQTRINVLTAKSDNYKEKTLTDRISPVVSDNDEPFFFRAQSGECIEFRHTNELPKELELDDFQVKTPTDTVGQHIHLVKFDVTASDGAGNGWNYEDGTFAADELSARRCAATLGEVSGDGVWNEPVADECTDGVPERKNIWRLPLTDNRDNFQTTVQRWFADPVLSSDERDIDQDRTLRTVFTHDHFGPSSIQQHGFYSALVIEPGFVVNEDGVVQSKLDKICEADGPRTEDPSNCVTPLLTEQRLSAVAWGNDILTGTHKQILLDGDDPVHPNYREFALSIADFALLYDPRDKSSPDEFDHNIFTKPFADESGSYAAKGNQGMHRLVCEAIWRKSPYWLDESCGNAAIKDEKDGSWFFEGHVPPAWVAGGRHRDDIHKSLGQGDLLAVTPTDDEIQKLYDHAITYRQKAARVDGPVNVAGSAATLAKPVAPPERPESISVDHHDPYLVNYRGAPIPLRIGDKLAAEVPTQQSNDCAPLRMARQGTPTMSNGGDDPDSEVVTALIAEDVEDAFGDCSIARQVEGPAGDMASALMSSTGLEDFAGHGDPETPLLEAYQGERLVFRLIQGAQEVQHTFNIAGLAFKRNIDQAFASGSQPLGISAERVSTPTLRQECFSAATAGRPDEYRSWLDSSSGASDSPLNDDSPLDENGDTEDTVASYWKDYEKLLAECDNIEGFTFAQEVGISEHFEMQGSLRSDVAASPESTGIESAELEAVDTGLVENNTDTAADETTPPDFLYNFGSVDALWNGAWGLLRIYPDANTPIPASDSHAPGNLIEERLGGAVSGIESQGDPDPDLRASEIAGLACPRHKDGRKVRYTDAVIAAIETRSIWPLGTDYGSERYDPDGLMLALLDPESLTDGKGFRASTKKDWESLERDTVESAIKERYKNGPMPMTLRVNAGDCVRLRFVNLLEETTGGGLRDLLGDAELPPIVGLNADPFFSGVSFETDEVDGRSLHRVGRLDRPETGLPPGGLRPSASLALSIGLPGMNLIRDVPLAYGNNKPALPPYREGQPVPVSDELRFYAGRYRLDINDIRLRSIVGQLEDKALEYVTTVDGGWLSDGSSAVPATGTTVQMLDDVSAVGVFASEDVLVNDGLFDMLGKSYVVILGEGLGLDIPVNPDTPNPSQDIILDGEPESVERLVNSYCGTSRAEECRTNVISAVNGLQAQLQQDMLDALDDNTHWIPYAFGAVPVRSLSDVISHAQHGLFGAIDVLPASWNLTEEHGVTMSETDDTNPKVIYRSMAWKDKTLPVSMAATDRGVWEGDPAVFDVDALEEGQPTHRIREFVLYYQDGLNLWDGDSRIDWKWSDNDELIRVDDPRHVDTQIPVLAAAGNVQDATGSTITDWDNDIKIPLKTVPDCPVCDDSYDRGDYAVNYRSPAFSELLNRQLPDAMKIDGSVEASDDMNIYTFPADYLDPDNAALAPDNALRLVACPGEEVVIRVIHPGGRARQRSFVMNGYSYEDLFPGFGFPNSALLGPGKSISAWLYPEAIAGRTVFWHDGPTGIRSGGVWGLLEVGEPGSPSCPG